MADLDHKHPIIFFPIRIETKYHHSPNEGLRILRLRFFPDQVTIDNFDPRLTRKEVEDARAYWKTIDDRNSAWIKLANQYGLPKAAYITKAVIDYDPDSEADPVTPSLKADDDITLREEGDDNLAPSCKLLPSHFVVYGKFKDSKLASIKETGKDIPKSLPLNPLHNIDTAESTKWVTDFEEALKKGMAIEIPLNEQQYKSGFEYIIVYGVLEDHSPDQTKQEIESLFRAHRYTDGLSLVKQGTPTNLVKGRSKERQSFISHHNHHATPSDINAYRSIEFAALPEERAGLIGEHALDGRILERALGLDHVANGLLNADNDDQLTAACMSTALWPAVLGDFMKRFANIQSLNLDNLQNHFIRYVSAQGIVPPICVGKTPYGILPITILSDWEDKALVAGSDQIRTFFEHLKKRWTNFVNQVPTVMNKTDDVAENLLNILSMEAISHNYYVRGFRSLNYIADFIFEILGKKTANGQQIVSSADLVIKNKLLLNILLKVTFPFIPNEALKGFYDLTPGRGITSMNFPLVTSSKDPDILDPPYLEQVYNDIKDGGERNFFKTTVEQTGIPSVQPSSADPLLFRLLRYSASLIGEKNDQKEIQKFTESLEILRNRKIKPDRLKTLMLQTLDLVSFRLDAWISSFANQRLDHLRRTTGNGLHVGAFGWIENLMPKEELQNGVSTKNKITKGGYIQAPSYAHAAAAAVLRNGYLTHSNEPEKKDLLKINLNSERTKNALEIINGIANTPVSELLGYRLERRLHDAKLDYLIDEFRQHFPLNKDDRAEPEDALEQGQERIEPRNLTDGLAVFKNWKRLTDNKIKMENDTQVPGWKSFYFEIRHKYAADQDEKMLHLINQLKPELNFLLDQMDGLSDLCLAESVFQAASGNYSRSGAVLDGMSGDGQIPIPEISLIPRAGPRQIQRIALALEAEPWGSLRLQSVDDRVPWTNPRKLAEPNMNKLVKSYIGTISFWIDLKDTSGNVISTEELGLTELELEAIDLLYIENSELDARLNYYAKSRGFNSYDIRYEQKDSTPEQIEKRSLRDLQFLINALRGMMAQGQPLKFSDFISPNETIKKELLVQSIKEIFQRYYDIILLLLQTLGELESASSEVSEPDIEKKRQALMKAGFFASEFAVPISPEGNIIESVSVLNHKITGAIEQLKSRLPQAGDQAGKLLAWRSKLETDGEPAFLESLADELSGESENKSKYVKTIDHLVEQIRRILNINSFPILAPFTIPSETNLKSSSEINRQVLKWIEKASYVRPRMKFLDEIITYNQILESSDFSFYCDENKFMKSAEDLAGEKEEVNPVSIILAISTKTGEQEESNPLKSLAGVVADEWTDKIVSKEQDTYITFHYNGPNTEAPQCLLLAVSPNDLHRWNEITIRKVILETLKLTKLRAVDYRSIKELRHFLPALLLNSHGEDIFINLFQGKFT